MTKRFASMLLACCVMMCSSVGFAATSPNPADYTETIHVTSSRFAYECTPQCTPMLILTAAIGGHTYTLERAIAGDVDRKSTERPDFQRGIGYLALGDYKAKLLPINQKDPDFPYYVIKGYELIFADGRVAGFQVVGQME